MGHGSWPRGRVLAQTERGVEIKYIDATKGRGVFATTNFRKGDVLEICVLLTTLGASPAPKELEPYALLWGDEEAFVSGCAHFYNHSDVPNIEFERRLDEGVVVVRALQRIAPGDELCHTYACAPWFEVK